MNYKSYVFKSISLSISYCSQTTQAEAYQYETVIGRSYFAFSIGIAFRIGI